MTVSRWAASGNQDTGGRCASYPTQQSTAGEDLGGGRERKGRVGGMERRRWVEFFCEGDEDDVDHDDGHDGADGVDDDGSDDDDVTIN